MSPRRSEEPPFSLPASGRPGSPPVPLAAPDHIGEEAEWNLVRELVRLPQVIVSAARAREPHRLTGYVDEIAGLYNQFWNSCRGILKQEDDRRFAQLHLSLVTRHVIRVVLDMIGVDAPEKMEKRD